MHCEYTRRWRAKQPTTAEKAAATLAAIQRGFTFHPDGSITSPTVAGQGVGYITEQGRYVQESRYVAAFVCEALTRAMAADPARVWPDRYQRFLASASRLDLSSDR
jgi:hypothetical protein